MTKKNPVYFLWPVAVLILPLLLEMIFWGPYGWREWNSVLFPLYAWLGAIQFNFTIAFPYGLFVYPALIAAYVWWFRQPKFESGYVLLGVSAMAGPLTGIFVYGIFRFLAHRLF